MDTRGEEIEDWMVERHLILINNPEDPPTFYSRRWKSQSSLDIAIATEDIQPSQSSSDLRRNSQIRNTMRRQSKNS